MSDRIASIFVLCGLVTFMFGLILRNELYQFFALGIIASGIIYQLIDLLGDVEDEKGVSNE